MSLEAASPQLSASVFASAGSGKTWLLVTRIVRLLLAGARPEGILAVTFTRKAAGEMQARLRERLRGYIGLDDTRLTAELARLGVDPTSEHLRRARGLHEALLFAERGLRTTTFHALFQEILRRFPLEAEVPPGFELLETTGELRAQAWEALFAEATRTPDGALARALETLFDRCGGLDGARTALESFLSHRSDWWAYTEEQADALEFADAQLAAFLDWDPSRDPFAEFFAAPTPAELGEYAQLLHGHATQTNLGQAQSLTAALEALASGAPEEAAFTAVRRVLLTDKDEPRVRKPSKAQAKALGDAGEARLLALHAALAARLQDALDGLARAHALAMGCAWHLAGERYLQHYQRLKAEQRVLDFTDLEWRAYRLLNHPDHALWVQYKLDQRIDHLLIDEFQDTNPTQWRMILPLLEELAAAAPERERSVFLVGDPKQSIYGFRRAKPELQAEAATWVKDRLAGHCVPLDRSWRSAPAVIEAVNQIFTNGPLAAQLPDFQPHATHLEDLWGAVELLPLVEPAQGPEPAPREGLRDPLREPRAAAAPPPQLEEGRQIAARIRGLVESGTPVVVDGRLRPATYGDIFILVRSRTHAAALERPLREAGIPYLGTERGTLLESLEIQDLVALLELLTTPYNDLALARVLRSPLFDASDDDLVALAAVPGRGPWIERLQHLAEQGLASPALQHAQRCLARWRTRAGQVPIHDLLDRIFWEGDVLERYRLATREDRRPATAANLTRFLELALEIDSGRYPSLVRFLARLKGLQAGEEAPDTPPAAAGQSRVRIMTIHASKGLEAPIVFLADAAVAPNGRDAFSTLVDWPAEAARPRRLLLIGRRRELDQATLGLVEAADRAEQREQANLLYVALTRARQYLFVSGTASARSTDDTAYHWIRDALAEAATVTPEGGLRLALGTPPVAAREPSAAPAPSPPPAGLDHALAAPALDHEIAPSRSVGIGGQVAAEDEDARTRGIAIHRLLDWLASGIDVDVCRTRLAAELGRPVEDPELTAWFIEAQAVVADPTLAGVFDSACFERALNEVPLLYARGDRRVHGVVDRLVLRADEVLLVDYKTHRIETTAQATALAHHYRPQLALYAEGIRRLWPGRPLRSALLFTATRTLHVVEGV